MNSISAKELKELIDKKKEYALIDVREPYEGKEYGSIPTAINIPLEELKEKLATKQFNKKEKLIFYCRTGGRSRYATEIASAMGFEHTTNLIGGIYAWSEIDPNVKKY